MHFVIVDIETTGGNPKESKITEIAMYKHDGFQIIDQYESLVNPLIPIPEFIVRLTGISDKMVSDAPEFHEIAKEIIQFMEGCSFVAHNVAFDYGVIRSEYRSLGYDFRYPHLCTVKASRTILPGHESYSLGKLTKDLGIKLIGRHRAGGDAHATALLFEKLFQKSKEELFAFIQQDVNPKNLHPDLDLFALDEIPGKTGIYQFFNDQNELIYVGRSKNIKKRIEQHLQKSKSKADNELMPQICRIEHELTGSELIAQFRIGALLENNDQLKQVPISKKKSVYGLYSYEDSNGYMHLYYDKLAGKTQEAHVQFSTKTEANTYLVEACEKYELCQKLCGIFPSTSSCFAYQVQECKGACVQAEDAENYNQRVQQFLEELPTNNNSFYLIEDGRNRNEKCIILIEKGSFRGYGYVPYYFMKQANLNWKNHIDYQVEHNYMQEILQHYFRTQTKLNIVQYVN
ncbi:MAG: exonuclease domain-containing protein [Crocinitomicaceae bacterium]|nr:exonuclease domain-containing protein [Crocinitomicaceae bacterium]